MPKNYYAALGLLPSAEQVVIKAAYKALAQRYHPDKFDGDADVACARMEALNEAYQVLSNSKLRQAYDQKLVDDPADYDGLFADWVRAFVRARRHGD